MLTWVRDNLKDLKPENFYKKFGYSHISRKQAEEKLRELLIAIKNENNIVNRKKANCLLDSFKSWTHSINCERYWLDVEVSLCRSAHEVVGRISAYNTIKNFVRKINDEEEALNKFQPPSKRVILKRPQPLLDIYEMNLDWAPWKFNAIINNIDLEQILQDLYKKCQKTRPKTKTSLDCGIIDLNNGVILETLGESIKMYFEEKIQRYKLKKDISEDVAKTLKKFNVTSLEDLGKVLSEVKIDYNNLDRDIVYVHRLFQKFFLLFQDNGSLNLSSSELHEGWYNTHVVAPIFDDRLESVDEWILRRDEVQSCAQKCLDRRTRKRKKYDGILSFSRQFEFIYVETATEDVLSKLHQAIILMFKLMVSTLPEKLLEEISSMPVLCVQFNGASTEIYLANWPANMRPIVFSITEFDIPDEITALPKLTKVAARMLSLRSFILDLNKKYQALLKKAADYYLDEDNDDNDWDSPLKLKVRR